jgi:uncharacterized membrane protein
MSSFSVGRTFPMSRTRWGWLPISVALNLVLIGVILGWASRSHTPAPRQALVTWQRQLLPSLPPADAAIVSSATDSIAAEQATGDTTVHQAYLRMRQILAVSPLDTAAMADTFESIRAARDQQQTAVDKSFFNELSSLSPEGRAIVLKAMEVESRRRHPPGGH